MLDPKDLASWAEKMLLDPINIGLEHSSCHGILRTLTLVNDRAIDLADSYPPPRWGSSGPCRSVGDGGIARDCQNTGPILDPKMVSDSTESNIFE